MLFLDVSPPPPPASDFLEDVEFLFGLLFVNESFLVVSAHQYPPLDVCSRLEVDVFELSLFDPSLFDLSFEFDLFLLPPSLCLPLVSSIFLV